MKVQNVTERNDLVLANVGLAGEIAKAYAWSGVDYEDLVQEGVIGLMAGAEKFEPDLGFAVGTYAGRAIHMAIKRAIVHHHLPYRMTWKTYVGAVRVMAGGEPEGRAARAAAAALSRTHGLVEFAHLAAPEDEEVVDAAELLASLRPVWTERENAVMNRVYGLDGEDPVSMSAVARSLGVSDPAVHDVRNRALRRARVFLRVAS